MRLICGPTFASSYLSSFQHPFSQPLATNDGNSLIGHNMVNTGIPSGGCTVCRKRKIKVGCNAQESSGSSTDEYQCDERRPGCERCTKYGIACPGYERPLQFHDYWSRLPRTRPRKRNKSRATRVSGSPTIGSPAGFRPYCEDECVQFFLKQYTLPSWPGYHPGHMEFLQDLCAELDRDTCLKPALQSVSYLAMYNQTKSTEVQLRAHEAHGAALRAVSRDLSSLTDGKVVHSLAAIMLLALFDVGIPEQLSLDTRED